ncbi:MAG: 3-deoxy-manno-octulosonate cytidylyltransferase [Candidatus Cloacimonetes bacterium]|nr:3-deoxy-manno-octulosonate cytidylyltransferase [Candidatus Cloacimonadota bacterium]
MKVVAIIPARYDSKRLPGKPLIKIHNKPLIQIVYENVEKTKLFYNVIIATDDKRIYKAVKSFKGKVEMTSQKHKCGTERVAEVAYKINADIFLNIQGDELFITKEPLKKLIQTFSDTNVLVATLIHPISDIEEIKNPNKVKVIFDKNDFAIYFSRSPLPYKQNSKDKNFIYYGHIGVYAFRKSMLFKFSSLKQSALEQAEKLEQLRLIENDIKIKVVKTDYSGFSINTEADFNNALNYKQENH